MENWRANLAQSTSFTLSKGDSAPSINPDNENTFFKASNLLAGTILDNKYRIEAIIGRGGMGCVYKAHHLMLNRDVALKTISSAQLSPEGWARFEREAKAVAQLESRHIVRIFDFGVAASNQPYYTMELLHGQSLDQLLQKQGSISKDQAIKIFAQVAQGLISAHNKKIVHRDLKPANIFIDQQITNSNSSNSSNNNSSAAIVKIVDFGIAKLLGASNLERQRLTSLGTVFGSPLYMSPEQSLGESVDERSDVYSYACSFYQALCGRPPFIGNTAFDTIMMHQNDRVPPLTRFAPDKDFPPWLEALLAAMLEKDQEHRVQSFKHVLKMLEEGQFKTKSSTRPKPPASAASSQSANLKTEHDSMASPSITADSISTTGSLSTTGSTGPISLLGAQSNALKITLTIALLTITAATAYFLNQDAYFLNHDAQKSAPNLVPSRAADLARLNTLASEKVSASAADLQEEQIFASKSLTADSIRRNTVKGLYVSNPGPLSKSDLKLLGEAKITQLTLDANRFKNQDLALIKKLPLVVLSLVDTTLDDLGAAQVAEIKGLHGLTIANSKLSPDSLKALAKLKNLQRIKAEGLPLTDDFLKLLAANKNLRVLFLRNSTGISAKNLHIIARSNVSYLRLSQTAADDSWLESLTPMPSLRGLELSHTNVTAGALNRFCQSHPQLTDLDFSSCPRISEADAAVLRQRFRGVRFYDVEVPALNDISEKVKLREW